jgi:hypothetical protein
MNVCKACGGFGLIIKKEERNSVDGQGGTVRLHR